MYKTFAACCRTRLDVFGKIQVGEHQLRSVIKVVNRWRNTLKTRVTLQRWGSRPTSTFLTLIHLLRLSTYEMIQPVEKWNHPGLVRKIKSFKAPEDVCI